MYKNIDRKLVRAAIATITAEIKEMKSRKREAHHPRWSYTDDWAFVKAKKRATILCCIQADGHAKLHIKKTDFEEQDAFLAKHEAVIEDFALVAQYGRAVRR